MARPPQKYVVAAAFVAAMFISILDATVVNVALPSIAESFGVAAAEAEWVVVGYLLSLAVFIPASGWIGDRFGQKRTFLVAVSLFTVASALCGVAGSLEQLVVSRIVQGIGGGMLTPVGTAMLFRAFPPAERAQASRILIVPTVMAPALGPLAGGFLVDALSWHWIFLINVPIGATVVVAGAALLEEQHDGAAGRFDATGFVLSGAGLALLLYAFSRGAEDGWATPPIVITGVAGALATTALVAIELRTREPLLHLRLFANRLFRATNLACFFGFGAFLAMLFTTSLFVQAGKGMTALQAGTTTFPEAIGIMVGSQLAGRVYPHVGPRRMIAGGYGTLALMLVMLGQLDYGVDLWTVRGLMFVAGLGMGFVFLALQAATFAQVSQVQMGQASALYNTQRQTAGAVGVAVVATVLQVRADGPLSAGPGPFHAAYLAAAAMGTVGAVMAALWIRDADAAATMVKRPSKRRAAQEVAPGDGKVAALEKPAPARTDRDAARDDGTVPALDRPAFARTDGHAAATGERRPIGRTDGDGVTGADGDGAAGADGERRVGNPGNA